MNRKSKIILFSGLGVTSVAFLIYQNIRRNQIFNELVGLINRNTTQNNARTNKVLNGQFHKELISQNPNKAFIKLSDTATKGFATQFESAIKGWGTNENKLSDIVNALRDKVAFSQVASYYASKYNKSLQKALEDDLSNKDYLNEIVIPINQKIDVRWA